MQTEGVVLRDVKYLLYMLSLCISQVAHHEATKRQMYESLIKFYLPLFKGWQNVPRNLQVLKTY